MMPLSTLIAGALQQRVSKGEPPGDLPHDKTLAAEGCTISSTETALRSIEV